MSSATMPNFRRGGSAAHEAEEEARKAAAARKNNGPEYFKIDEDGGSVVVRLITDDPDWIWVDQHSYVPTKPGPKDAENWPKSMTCVCRKDKAFTNADGSPFFPDCYVDLAELKNGFGKRAYPQIRVWALAIERELVRGDGTEALGGPAMKDLVVGVRDKMVEVEEQGADGKPTGRMLHYPKVLIINQPQKTFFSHLRAMYGLHRTVCDRDYMITREGSGTDTVYRFAALDPIDGLKPGTPQWERYEQVLTERKIDLASIVFERASDAFYAKFFDPRFIVDDKGNVLPATGAVPAAGGMVDLSQGAPAAPAYSSGLQDRIRQMGQPKASTSDDQPPY